MEFFTKLSVKAMEHRIAYGDRVLFLGSCFAEEVGRICRGLGFDAEINPFGTLYNPLSIASSIDRMSCNQPFTSEEVIKVGEEFYCTFNHNNTFWDVSSHELLTKVNHSLARASEFWSDTKWVVISLGTSWVYHHLERNICVANCHKLPASQFQRIFLDVDQTYGILSEMISKNPDKKFIFTVSPLRHLKDGLHGNQISKAALLLAVDRVCKNHSNAFYFPAYEILLDELRDYRFYKPDMIHPSEQAVRYIWERFVDLAIDESQREAIMYVSRVRDMLHHRPFFEGSQTYEKFMLLREQKLEQIRRLYPLVVIDNLSGTIDNH